MRRAICIAIVVATSTAQAAATPCVSSTFDVPFPGATDVTSHVTDLPSSAFPAFWQEGRLDGYDYQIFANATGVLRGGGNVEPWKIEVLCDAFEESCTFIQTGKPPEPATRSAAQIAQCLVPTFAPDETAQESETVAEPNVSDNGPVEAPSTNELAAPCGLAATDEATDVATLQRLLVLLGENPGPVDGFLGPKTFSAMEAFVSNPDWETSISDLLPELSEKHCAQTKE